MKPKKTRLALNKRTISNLENQGMKNVVGGAPSYNGTCETWGGGSCTPYVCYSDVPPAICPGVTWYTVCTCNPDDGCM
jgi:hypothetical protein